MVKKILFLLILGVVFCFTPISAASLYCSGLKSTLKIIGEVVRILKILVPSVIIVIGIFDLFKAITASKDDAVMKAVKSIILRLASGVLIFFLPTLIVFVFDLVDGFSPYENDYKECVTCVLNVKNCE